MLSQVAVLHARRATVSGSNDSYQTIPTRKPVPDTKLQSICSTPAVAIMRFGTDLTIVSLNTFQSSSKENRGRGYLRTGR
jgi:hypothetical protein